MTPRLLFDLADLAGRILIAALFIWDAWVIVTSYDATLAYMATRNVPAIGLPPALLVQLVGGILIAVGWQTRLAALALAGFCFATALIFHSPVGEMAEKIQFWKDLAIAGGLLTLFAGGAGRFSLDQRRRAPIV
jgi:putative oxidoreductase